MKGKIAIFLPILFLFIGISAFISERPSEDWSEYLGGLDRNHFSKLNQINLKNAHQLKIAWTYSMPDSGQMQSNPLVVQGVLYGISSNVQAFALDAVTGKEIWRFGDPLKHWSATSRGVSYWTNGLEKRILFTAGSNLWALDADTGKPIVGFGDQGKLDLHTGLPAIAKDKFVISNTPGTIFENLIIMPVRLSEGADAAPGDIRAFDVRTGKLVWSFHTIPYPGEYGYETWPKDAYKNEYVGAANNWAGMAVDPKRGIIYIPTGSAGYDFWGGNRKGKNLFANCLLALDIRSGKRLWHFQTTHHDLWDRDLPAPPNLITITRNGKKIDAVAQITKQGYVFVFDRVTGKPLFPIVERKVSTKALPGEKPWKTQPMPLLPAPYARQSDQLKITDINPYSKNPAELKKAIQEMKRAWYFPPTETGTMILPGFDGGGEWGGAGADPDKGIIYINSNEMARTQIMKKEKITPKKGASATFQTYCASCHGENLEGNIKSGFPALAQIYKTRNKAFILNIINQGKGMMPGFPQLSQEIKNQLSSFLMKDAQDEKDVVIDLSKNKIPYKMTGYIKFLDSTGLPGISPPWSTLNAIDLNSGKYLWKIPFGDEPDLAKIGIHNTGAENYGGPIITENGLLIIGAAKDGKMRIYNRHTGKLIFETQLPAAAFATPSTYQVAGKQYIVIACGGTKLGVPKGNSYVAYALP